MKTLKFLVNHAPYKAGDLAGVSDSEAKRLVSLEVAEYYKAAKEDKQVTEPKENKMLSSPTVAK